MCFNADLICHMAYLNQEHFCCYILIDSAHIQAVHTDLNVDIVGESKVVQRFPLPAWSAFFQMHGPLTVLSGRLERLIGPLTDCYP